MLFCFNGDFILLHINIVTQSADSRYVIIIGIVVDVFVRANIESFIMLSCFKSIGFIFPNIVALIAISNSVGGIEREKTSLGIRADK